MTEMDLETALREAELTVQARRHYSETDSYAAWLATRYRKFHHFYAPLNGDQWPEDRTMRPGMVHITHNIIAPAVLTESRIESILPKAHLDADSSTGEVRERAEKAEKIGLRWLEASGWETWLNEATLPKSIYGKVVLKPYWDVEEKRPDVSIIDTPEHLRIGWGSSDYTVKDWALYEFSLSPIEAMRRFPELRINPPKSKGGPLEVYRHSDHADPLDQVSEGGQTIDNMRNPSFQVSDYEQKQVRVWDYWYKDISSIKNAFFVEGVLVASPKDHSYYPDLPFIVIQHDREPGSPEGMGDVEPLLDIQMQLNQALSHWSQLIVDEIDPAWQIDADSVPGGMVPMAGEIIAAGEGRRITPIEKGVNQFPIQALVDTLMKSFHFRSGLSEILFALPPGAQTAGRALAIQIEAAANRIDPRRARLYKGLRDLMIFWFYMGEKINPAFPVGENEDGSPVMGNLRDITEGFRRWMFIAPEITPRDNLELITAVVNKLNAKLISLEDAMDELGVNSPLEMIQKIEAERMNPKLFPGDTQAYVAVLNMLQQLQAQQAAMGGAEPQVPGGDPAAQAEGQLMAEGQEAAPGGVQGDNGDSVAQPMTQAGMAPPPGAPLSNQTLIRAQPNGSAQALQQIKVTT